CSRGHSSYDPSVPNFDYW
nr:immunoglobulin heavy chain junction region [Macaca mulatta]MOW24673.1 immunoglobulin heavy chain junction region [Macaca mulatta]MOW25287.1 immunoglobulin heavy chain junction region [Macaca mulatta]